MTAPLDEVTVLCAQIGSLILLFEMRFGQRVDVVKLNRASNEAKTLVNVDVELDEEKA